MAGRRGCSSCATTPGGAWLQREDCCGRGSLLGARLGRAPRGDGFPPSSRLERRCPRRSAGRASPGSAAGGRVAFGMGASVRTSGACGSVRAVGCSGMARGRVPSRATCWSPCARAASSPCGPVCLGPLRRPRSRRRLLADLVGSGFASPDSGCGRAGRSAPSWRFAGVSGRSASCCDAVVSGRLSPFLDRRRRERERARPSCCCAPGSPCLVSPDPSFDKVLPRLRAKAQHHVLDQQGG
jgi:hypothetical protein